MKAQLVLLFAALLPTMAAHAQTLDWLHHYGGDPAEMGVQRTEICSDYEGGVYLATAIRGDAWDPDGANVDIAGGSDILFQHFSEDGELDWTLSTGGGCMSTEYPAAMLYKNADIHCYVSGVHQGDATLGNYAITGNCEESNMFLAAIAAGGTPTAFKSIIGTAVAPTAMLVNLDGALEVFGTNEVTPAVFQPSPLISTAPGVFRAIYTTWLQCVFAERILRTGNISAAYRNGQYQVLAGNYMEADTLWGVPLAAESPQYTGFVCKKLVSGIAWLRTVGSSTYATVGMAAQLSGGDIVISGKFQGDAHFGTVTLEGPPDDLTGYLARYTTNGDLVWARKVYAPGGLALGKIVGDTGDGFYMAGSFTQNLTIGNATVHSTTSRDFFVAHMNASGVWDGVQQMGPGWFDRGLGLAVDADGIYVAGNFDSTMVVDGQQFEPRHQGATDLFVARFNGMEPVTSVQPLAETGSDVLRIYANPTDGRCSIDLPTAIAVGSQLQVKIYDNIGDLVQQIPLTVNEQRTAPVVIEAEASGVYHVEVLHEGRRYAGTLVFDR